MTTNQNANHTFLDLADALSSARNQVIRLERSEVSTTQVMMKRLAQVIEAGVRLYQASKEHGHRWRTLCEHEGIVSSTGQAPASPCHLVAKMLFQGAPASTLSRHAAAIEWANQEFEKGTVEANQIADLIVREGGSARVAKRLLDARRPTISEEEQHDEFVSALSQLPVVDLSDGPGMAGPDDGPADPCLLVISTSEEGGQILRHVHVDQATICRLVLKASKLPSSEASLHPELDEVEGRDAA